MAKTFDLRSLFDHFCIFPPILLGFSFLLLTFQLSYAQTPPGISLGSSITAGSNSIWSSPSGDFAFGFYPLSSGRYLAGIWFDKIQERTLIWSANRDDPAEAGSTISLTSHGLLVLTYQNGTVQTISGGRAANSGFMQDNGNFVLRDSNALVWQSFDSPTDTILPGQVFVQGRKLFSNSNGTVDYSTGNYMLEMQAADGNLVISAYRYGDPGYWYTNTLFTNVSLVFNQISALMYVVNGTGDNIYSLSTNVTTPVEDYYHRATIDDQGNFQQYAYHKTNGSSWIRMWRAINEPCDVYSICGIYGFCTSSDNETVTCSCLPGYIPMEPSVASKRCRPETVINYCTDQSMKNFTLQVIDDADFPPHDNDLAKVSNVSLDGCRKIVMDDCYTIAAYFVDSTCYKRREPLLASRRTASTKGIKAFIKVPEKINDGNIHPKKKSKARVYLKAGVITSSLLAFLFGVAAVYYLPFTRQLLRRKWIPDPTAIGINFRQFTYKELQEATNGFSNRLGRGSSGSVYSGMLCLKDMEIEIAVKKLDKVIEESAKEFMTELKIIGRKYHKNLVRLLGFCIENNHLLLVFELMKNGTLSGLLFKEGKQPIWSLRYEMALGIAKGLLYLHEECETQIIHCDIKPQNVLLDHSYRAKIADFGLSKLLKKDQTRTETHARGTIGYMAPEWLRNAPITAKVDVYSFGVMLLEIGCARRHIELSRVEEESEDDELVLIEWVLFCVRSRNLQNLAMNDPEILSDLKRFERVIMVGLWCVFPDPILRPSMKKVVEMLEGSVEVGVPPLVHQK